MRIIAGSRRGAKLETLGGDDTRPTLDRVKEAIFSMIAFDIPGKSCLDLFAGSGAIGFELLSRGARSATMVESERRALQIIERNKRKLAFGPEARIVLSDWRQYLEGCSERFDIVYLDPPYGKGWIEDSIRMLCRRDLLNSGALLIAESSVPADFSFDLSESKIRLRKTKKYGKIDVSVFCKGEL